MGINVLSLFDGMSCGRIALLLVSASIHKTKKICYQKAPGIVYRAVPLHAKN